MGNFFSSEDAAVDRELSALSPVASFELDVRIAARRGSTPSTHRLRINSTTPLSELVRNVAAIACRTYQPCRTKSLKLAYVDQNGLAVPLDTDESFCRAKLHAMNCCSTLLITCDEDTSTGTAGSNHEDNIGELRKAFEEGGGNDSDAASTVSDPQPETLANSELKISKLSSNSIQGHTSEDRPTDPSTVIAAENSALSYTGIANTSYGAYGAQYPVHFPQFGAVFNPSATAYGTMSFGHGAFPFGHRYHY